jgi:hypothetical protein
MKQIYIVVLLICSSLPVTGECPKILIDTGHGGYPITDGKLTEFEELAQEKGFSVEFSSLSGKELQHFSLVLSVNPDSPFSRSDCGHIGSYLEGGGTFFLLGSGDYENRDHSEVTNPLLRDIESHILCNDDQLEDTINCGKSYIPLFDDWKAHPLTADLPPISLYSTQSLVCKEGAFPLLVGNTSTYSRDSDDTPPPPQGGPFVVLAVEKIGMGNLLVGGSYGFVSGLTYEGHHAFMERLLSYVHGEWGMISSYGEQFRGATIHIGDTCRKEVDGTVAHIIEGCIDGKIPGDGIQTSIIIGGPHVNALCKKFNRYLPVQFKEGETWYLQRGNTQYRGQEYGLIACLFIEGQRILIISGVGGTGTMGAVKVLSCLDQFPQIPVYNVYGEALIVHVTGDENLNGIEEESESWVLTLL